MSGMDTIDIEDFAQTVKSTVVGYYTSLIWLKLSMWAPWINIPVLRPIVKGIIEKGVELIATEGALVAFFINTKVFTIDQAKDYVAAVNRLHNAPEGMSDAEWQKLEQEANHAFHNLINFSR